MTHYCILRAAKLTTYGNLAASGQHTWRERETFNADPERTHLNTNHGPATSAAELVEAVKQRIELAEYKAERPVLAIEYLITASPEALSGMSEKQREAYFADSLKYLEAKHGKENIVAANVQRDESTQHLVVYAVPLVQTAERTRRRSVIVGTNPDGTKRRETREFTEKATSKLSAAAFLDGPAKLSKLQTAFAKDVGAKHGLERGLLGSKAHHKEVSDFYAQIKNPTPRVGKIQIPEPSLRDRIDPQAYGERVRNAVIEQIRPAYSANEAKAKAHDAALRQAVEARATAARAEKHANEAKAKNAELERRCAELSATVAMFTPQEHKAAQLRHQQAEQQRKKREQAEAEAKARRDRLEQERASRIRDLDTLRRRGHGTEYTLAVAAQRAISEAGGDAAKVDWELLERKVLAESVGEHGQAPETALAAVLRHSPGQSVPGSDRAVREWLQRQQPQLLARYEEVKRADERRPRRSSGPSMER